MKIVLPALMASVLATTAPAVTLDFSGDICNGGSACFDSSTSVLDQTYGDMTGVDFTYDRDASTDAIEGAYVWTTGYEEFSNALWTDTGMTIAISMVADAGYEVTLESLGIAPYENRVANTALRIVDLFDSSEVYNSEFAPLSTAGSTTISTNVTSTVGFTIFFGPDAFNAGLGRLDYGVALSDAPSPVPLPAAGLLLMAGLGGLMAVRRRFS